jgi:hypothetical protein
LLLVFVEGLHCINIPGHYEAMPSFHLVFPD